jgi:hypothetical protein
LVASEEYSSNLQKIDVPAVGLEDAFGAALWILFCLGPNVADIFAFVSHQCLLQQMLPQWK